MNKRSVFSLVAVAVAVVFAVVGWIGSEIANTDRTSPEDSIATSFITHVTLLTGAQGNLREPDDVAESARISLNSLSMGLVLHYDKLSKSEKTKLAPYLARARLIPPARNGTSGSILDCIREGSEKASVDEHCISNALPSK